jgi:tripartite-type tricarboxylate transporter receptor subunit TctC
MRAWRMMTAGLVMAAAVPAAAQEKFPSRPITIIVPFAAGGPVDQHMRAMGAQLEKILGQPILVDVKPGAGGTLGPATMAATAKPDGYTVTELPSGIYSTPALQKVSFDPARDFTYIIHLTGYRYGVFVPQDAKWQTWRDLVADAKAHPSTISYASTGTGSALHIGMEVVAQAAGIKLIHLPTKGAAEQVTSFLGGHVGFMPTGGMAMPLVEAKQARALLIWSDQLRAKLPGVPTLAEEGIRPPIPLGFPYGIGGPKGMRPEIVKVLHDAMKQAHETPEVKRVLALLEQDDLYLDTGAYNELAQKQTIANRAVVESMGLAAK